MIKNRPRVKDAVQRDCVKSYIAPVVPNLLFICCTRKYIDSLVLDNPGSLYFYRDPERKEPQAIDERQMRNFMLVTSAPEESLIPLDEVDRSILVEMSYLFRSPNLEDALFELQMAGFKPILAHPERYLYMADRLEEFGRLHENGCRFQLNYISFTGAYGLDSLRIIRYLARRGHCDFLSTDLHSPSQLERILTGDISLLLRKPFTRFLHPEQLPST